MTRFKHTHIHLPHRGQSPERIYSNKRRSQRASGVGQGPDKCRIIGYLTVEKSNSPLRTCPGPGSPLLKFFSILNIPATKKYKLICKLWGPGPPGGGGRWETLWPVAGVGRETWPCPGEMWSSILDVCVI